MKWLTKNNSDKAVYVVTLPNDQVIALLATSIYHARDEVYDVMMSREITVQYANYAVNKIKRCKTCLTN